MGCGLSRVRRSWDTRSAGVVEAVGPDVADVAPGDHVIACLSVFCGRCDRCLTGETYICGNRPVRSPEEPPRLSLDGKAVAQFAEVGGYAEQMLLHESGVVPIDKDVPFEVAALIGCGVTTGVGAALNTARVTPGSTVAVYGAGGVGLSVIQGARIAGARMIIAVDVEEHKLRTARDLGATHSVDASAGDPVEQIRDLTGGEGVDFSFEAIGLKRTVEQAFQSIRNGGMTTSIGMVPLGEKLEIPAEWLYQRTLVGSALGSNHFKIDMPNYIEFYRQGPAEAGRDGEQARPAGGPERCLRVDPAAGGRADGADVRLSTAPSAVPGWRPARMSHEGAFFVAVARERTDGGPDGIQPGTRSRFSSRPWAHARAGPGRRGGRRGRPRRGWRRTRISSGSDWPWKRPWKRSSTS